MIISGRVGAGGLHTGKTSDTARTENPVSAGAQGAQAASAPKLQSAVLHPAAEALRAMPEIDQAKVDALRDALARGEVPFNPVRLAALIERHHGRSE